MKHIQIDDLYNFKFTHSLMSNDEQTKAIFAIAQADKESNKYQQQLWELRADSSVRPLTELGQAEQVTFETENTILFAGEKDESDKEYAKKGGTTFYRLDLSEGGFPLRAFRLPFGVSANQVQYIAENRYLVGAQVSKEKPNLYLLPEVERSEYWEERKKESEYVTVYDEVPFYFNGAGTINSSREHLFYYASDLDLLLPLNEMPEDVQSAYLTRDKNTIYATLSRFNHLRRGEDANGKWYEVCKYEVADLESRLQEHVAKDATNKELAVVTKQIVREADKQFIVPWFERDGEVYYLIKDEETYGLNSANYLATIKDGKVQPLSDSEINPGDSVGTDVAYGSKNNYEVITDQKTGKQYMFTTDRYQCKLYEIDKEFSLKEVHPNNQDSVLSAIWLDGELFTISATATALPEIYHVKDAEYKRVSDFNASYLADYYVAKPQKITFPYKPLTEEFNPQGEASAQENVEEHTKWLKEDDGLIDGWVLLPPDFDPDKKYPAVLDIHGGPRTVYGEVFFHEMQVWAAKGYLVMFCNPRGGDGRGDRFADIRGKYGYEDYQDIMQFVDVVLAQYPCIDQAKLAVTGGSYGGFMTNWIVGHTDRFVCAATQRSISNWISFYGVSDIGTYFGTDQNYCDTNSEAGFLKLWHHSPLRYVNNVKTPLLFIHSDEDYRCPLEQGLQFFTALVHRGIDTKFCCFHKENHELSRSGKPKARIRRLTEITDWFGKYLDGKQA